MSKEQEGGVPTPRAAAILPAAGGGTRMGGVPKQLRLLGGVPVLVHAARAVTAHPSVQALVVAVPAGEEAAVRELLALYGAGEGGVIVTAGGATRQQSVAAALAVVPEACGLVLVHDAARPFLPVDRLAAVLEAANEHGAAALAVEAADTLRRVVDGGFEETVARDGLWRMQTPQVARTAWLRAALDAATRDGVEATDEVTLLRRAGYPVRLVEGDARNLKLTTPSDWEMAVALSGAMSDE
ncbi:MAG TPA: 2-C-methyl-D-erythritol 4-phosphate cytidylyltransferase [Rhodothermales bacterium]|nr:2-C-methyl-D-erythritol 4-phosphate cytidylyltransferase [Rhodothermales bacterium]